MLSVSIVIYHSNVDYLQKLLISLKAAIDVLPENKVERIYLIDNANSNLFENPTIDEEISKWETLEYISNPKNIGYGQAHNQAFLKSSSKFHLILNPDVVLERDTIAIGLDFLQKNKDVVAVSPLCMNENHENQFLVKSFPSFFVLLLRGINIRILNRLFSAKLDQYICKEIYESDVEQPVNIISGCFMLCRTKALKHVNGFDSRYFLYFEDFSLSLKLNDLGQLYFLPEMKIIHFGGNASRKGVRHILLFMQSAIRFFNQYGWKLL